MSMESRPLRPPLTITVRAGHEVIANVQDADQIRIIGETPRAKSGVEVFVTWIFAGLLTSGGFAILLGLILWGMREIWERAL
jgi:hypothetical protein